MSRRRAEASVMQRIAKRVFDVIAASAGLIVLSPLLLALTALVRWRLGSPIFFKQLRAGRNAVPFDIYKFRTMTDERDRLGNLLPDDQRVTMLGRILRSSSLDEVPELFNVLIGDMSLVGPRPLLARYVGRYDQEQARRHEVRPGITGWAQVNGRNALTWEERFRLDVWYVDHWSLWLDARILVRTFAKVLAREGISPEHCATMPEFMGSEKRT